MDELSTLAATVARFMKHEVAPHVGQLDLQPAAPAAVDVPRLLAPLGLPGLPGVEGAGAEALPPATLVPLLWTMAAECAGVAAFVAHAAAGRLVAERLGFAHSAEPIALGLFEAREPFTADGTVDVAARVADERVAAEKRAVPLAPAAAAFGLVARRGPELCLAWVATGEGVTISEPLGLMGLRALPCADLRVAGAPLQACTPLPEADLVWIVGLLGLLLGACAGGTAAAALAAARAYASDRYQGGTTIDRHEAVALMLEANQSRLDAAHDALCAAADRFAPDDPRSWLAALRAKVATAPVATGAALDAVQVLGGYGYMRDYGLEKRLRDAVALGLLPCDATRLALLVSTVELGPPAHPLSS
jgi:isovaleryl-CoA dehydrogenase